MKRSVEEPAVEVRAEEDEEPSMLEEPTAGSLSAANYDLYEALEKIAGENGPWPQDGPDGCGYAKKSQFGSQGMNCANCVFFNQGGTCDIVEGEIAEEGLCRFWIIPNEKLSMEDPLESIGEEEPAPAEPQARSIDAEGAAARLKAKSLESVARTTK
jgi:hypothetical protein